MIVTVMDDTSERLDAVSALNALWTDAAEDVEHTMEVSQVRQVSVDLRDKAKGRAASLTNQLSLRDGRSDPSGLSSHLRWRELRLGD